MSTATRLLITAGATPLLPDGTISTFESRTQSSAKVEPDISGQPVVITLENAGADSSWSVGSPYLALSVVTACILAYSQNTPLSLVDELGTTLAVFIREYPAVVRHKQSDGTVCYDVLLTLQSAASSMTVPILSSSGPRLFY